MRLQVAFDIETEDTGKKKCINLTGPGGGQLLGLWAEEEVPLSGTVARWRTDKGFGFIKPDKEGEEDVFCHRSVIQVRDSAQQRGESTRTQLRRGLCGIRVTERPCFGPVLQ